MIKNVRIRYIHDHNQNILICRDRNVPKLKKATSHSKEESNTVWHKTYPVYTTNNKNEACLCSTTVDSHIALCALNIHINIHIYHKRIENT